MLKFFDINFMFNLGYHWQMDGRSQESQEGGQQRDAQGKLQFSFLLMYAFL
jgi:hypothetical protein